MTLLRFDGVGKTYPGGHRALDDLSFSVQAGEMVFITGHSGAGKSTLLKLAHLSERPSAGSVWFDGKNLERVRGKQVALHRRRLGVVHQDHCLLLDRTVADNVALPLLIAGLAPAEIQRRVRHALDSLGLAERAGHRSTDISTGEQQRVGIARAMALQPALLLADEPTGNLDPSLAADIMNQLVGLCRQGTAVVIASHDLALVKRMKKRVLVIDKGRLMDDISPEELADE
ncbi:ABC transporter ATP-binding protein [Arenimonas maotaiensis]|uniref:Cell division ATP-binding protein FtsE n=1 Tax=Arenimonas maotaiensis TaxID=1446479 RepID=A0A917FQ07_9GAMM|nr:ATP-binding cassette domain-containing protein [Arenimonas maotaiensis]GGF94115.1 ABC transporter ATP-binding protein [Arenimonas maotaiensis]